MSRNRRKSPYRHKVKNHMRKGKPVSEYDRGKGGKPGKPTKPRRRSRVVSKPPSELYDAVLEYHDGEVEELQLKAKNYTRAVSSGVDQREIYLKKITIRGVK